MPSAIATVAVEGGGWPAIFARNHALACELRRRVVDGLGGPRAPLLAPDDALGAWRRSRSQLPAGTAPLALAERSCCATAGRSRSSTSPRGPLVRVSAHLYNHAGEADLLVAKLRSLGVTLS